MWIFLVKKSGNICWGNYDSNIFCIHKRPSVKNNYHNGNLLPPLPSDGMEVVISNLENWLLEAGVS